MRAAWLSLFLALSLSAPSWGQGLPSPPAGPASAIYASELARLRTISARLAAISVALETRLEASEATSRRLSCELADLRTELSALKASLESSETRSAALEEMLAKSEALLERSTTSLAEYRREAEAEIARARRGARVWKIVGVVGLATGVIGGLAAVLK